MYGSQEFLLGSSNYIQFWNKLAESTLGCFCCYNVIMKKIIGVGVILETPAITYLFQERDNDAPLHPGRIAPFGGGIEDGEDAIQCAKREMLEELNLVIDIDNLEPIGLFESEHEPGVFIQMYIAKDIEKSRLVLNEGKNIIELSKEEAIAHDNVTTFTKRVLGSL